MFTAYSEHSSKEDISIQTDLLRDSANVALKTILKRFLKPLVRPRLAYWT